MRLIDAHGFQELPPALPAAQLRVWPGSIKEAAAGHRPAPALRARWEHTAEYQAGLAESSSLNTVSK